MSIKRYYRVYATGTHCACVDVYAESPEEARELGSQIDLQNYQVVLVHPGNPIIDEVEEIDDDEVSEDDTTVMSEADIPFLQGDDNTRH